MMEEASRHREASVVENGVILSEEGDENVPMVIQSSEAKWVQMLRFRCIFQLHAFNNDLDVNRYGRIA